MSSGIVRVCGEDGWPCDHGIGLCLTPHHTIECSLDLVSDGPKIFGSPISCKYNPVVESVGVVFYVLQLNGKILYLWVISGGITDILTLIFIH